MKYTVHDNDLRDFTFAAEAGAVVLQAVDYDFVFTEDQFRDFRKAVGFVCRRCTPMTDEKKPTYANVDEMKFAVAVAEALNTTLGKGDMSYGNYVVSSAQVTFEGDDSVRVVYLDDEYQIEVTQ